MKSERCHNRGPERIPWGNFQALMLGLVSSCSFHILFAAYFTKFARGSSLFVEKLKADESP